VTKKRKKVKLGDAQKRARADQAESSGGLVCRECGCRDFRVTHTYPAAGDRVRRRRVCRNCGAVRVTFER